MKTIAYSLFLIAPILLWTLWGDIAFGAIITHSHCPNHSRNNSDNMHTHDTTDPDHDAKHKAGHPHTWEFDENCPPGTERDISKKSQPFGRDPNTDKPTPADNTEDDDTETSGETQQVRTPANCHLLTGYAIETNDAGQIRITAPKNAAYAKLYLWFDDEEDTIYAVLIGYESAKSLTLEQYNTWLAMDDLQIVNYRQANAPCYLCKGVSVADAVKMVLRVSVQGVGLCPAAVYPEPIPAAPSKHHKLTTMWSKLKQ